MAYIFGLLFIYKMTTEKKLQFFVIHKHSQSAGEIQRLYLIYDIKYSKILYIFTSTYYFIIIPLDKVGLQIISVQRRKKS